MTLPVEHRRSWSAVGLLTAAMFGFPSCAASMSDAYVPSGTSLQLYRTYEWGPAEARATGDPRLDNNEIFDRHVRRGIEQQLRRHGFVQAAAADSSDVLVHYHATVSQKIDVRELDPAATLQHDAGDAGDNVYDEGSLVVDLVDARTRQLVWRGWVEGRLDGIVDNQRLMERNVDEALDIVFKQLPDRPLR